LERNFAFFYSKAPFRSFKASDVRKILEARRQGSIEADAMNHSQPSSHLLKGMDFKHARHGRGEDSSQ